MFKNYLVTALRSLAKNKLFTGINILGLSAGLACCMLIMLYAKDELSYDRFQQNAPTTFRLVRDEFGPDGKLMSKDGNTGMVHGPSFAREIPEIRSMVRLQGARERVRIGKEVFEQEGHFADSNFFSLFTFPLKKGNPATALEDPYSVVLTEETAKKLFGTSEVLGKTIDISMGERGAFTPFTVTGILPESPQNSSIKLSMLLPMSLNTRNGGGDDQWINFYLNTFIQLHPDADTGLVAKKMAQVYSKLASKQIQEAREKYDFNNTFSYSLQPLLDMHLSTDYRASNGLSGASNPLYSRILGGIALFILLIACINFVNLSVARSLKRAKEIGIRKVSGSRRPQLIAQFLGESLLLTILAFGLAVILVQLLLPFFNTVSNKQLSLSYLLDGPLVAGFAALLLMTAFLAGFYPAIVLSGFDPAETLYNRTRLTRKNRLSKALVVLQFSLSTFLIVATITIYSQFNYLTTRSLGYDDKQMLVFQMGHQNAVQWNAFKAQLQSVPSVKQVTARQGGFWFTTAKAEGTDMEFGLEVIDDNYLRTLNVPIVKGRGFSADFPGDSTASVLVNEAFVQKAGWKDPIGKEVDFFYNKKKYQVVGVVRDYHYESLLSPIRPQVFLKDPNYSYGMAMVKISPEGTSETIKTIEALFRKNFPLLAWSYEFKDEVNRKEYESEARWKNILAFGAILTILISCIGLFGLATLTAEKRRKEIGIRKVLGASVSGVARQLSVDFLRLVLVSGLVALPLSWWAGNSWLEHYPFRISMSVWMLLGALLMVMMVALATILYQSLRAATANPVSSLRSE